MSDIKGEVGLFLGEGKNAGSESTKGRIELGRGNSKGKITPEEEEGLFWGQGETVRGK